MAPPSNKRRKLLLASTRPIKRLNRNSNSNTTIPPNNTATATATSSLSSRTTQSIISTHHTLHKQLAQAKKRNDSPTAVAALEAAIEANGGLKLYQRASVTGQSLQRGGDTSKVLVDWLGLHSHHRQQQQQQQQQHHHDDDRGNGQRSQDDDIRILEVGALSATNALNIPGATRVRRIDLHSQDAKAIEQVDFMALDPQQPWAGTTGYDVVSLSLVVNYVSDPAARGSMLKHTVEFLRLQLDQYQHLQNQKKKKKKKMEEMEVGDDDLLLLLPALFLVLPRPCIDNSRYLSEDRLAAIMQALGYAQTRVKRSPRLYYSLWTLRTSSSSASSSSPNDDNNERRQKAEKKVFKKVEVRSGKDRNNFCIVLDPDDGDDDNENRQ